MSDIYLGEGPQGRAGGGEGRLSKRGHFIRTAGDVESYKPPKTKGICVTWNNSLAKL